MNEVPIGMHQGKVMMSLAGNYGNLAAVSTEVVQNGIDQGATRIEVLINLKTRSVRISDNGSGASMEKFQEALASIGSSMKERGRYGQFGLGLISPLSICREFTFTTCPESRKSSYVRYTFNSKVIREQARVSIPSVEDSTLTFDPSGKTWWRTSVELSGLVKDRRTTQITLDDLTRDLADKFREVIRSRPVQIDVTIIEEDGSKSSSLVVAPEFTGTKLDVWEGEIKESGKVKVELWTAQLTRTGRKGTILFGTQANPSRIKVKQFIVCAGTLLDPKVAKALASGVFEGNILCQKIAMHPDRTRFEDNDALLALCEMLEQWYKKVGAGLMEEAEEKASDDRYQRIGTSVMPFAEQLLRQKSFRAVAERIVIGTIGDGHSKVPKSKVIGQEDRKSVAVKDLLLGSDRAGEKKEGNEGGGSSTERQQHIPGIVYGVRGKRRVEVTGGSTGLRFEYVEGDDFRIPFEFDVKKGLVSFNIRNPNWAQCQEKDKFLQDYHIAVVTLVLTLQLHADANGVVSPEVEKFAFGSLEHHTFAITNGDAFTG